MTPKLRFVDRVLTALAGLVLFSSALWLIGYGADVRMAREAASRLDPGAIVRAPGWPWWVAVLAGCGVVLALIGTSLLLSHLRPSTVHFIADDEGEIDLARLAETAAADLGRHPLIQHTHASTRLGRGGPIVRIRAGVASKTSSVEIRRVARNCSADILKASGGKVDFQFLIEYVRPEKVRSRVI